MIKENIVGTEFKNAVIEIENGESICISREQDNKFDDNALKVTCNGVDIGYIGKDSETYRINRDLFPLEAIVIDSYNRLEFDNFKKHTVGSLVSLTFKLDNGVELKSFNEEDVCIQFFEENHIYRYGKEKLKGATTYIKKYIKEFPTSIALRNCEKAWGVEKAKVKNAWDLIGDSSRDFGSGIHKALEYEDLYRSYYKKNGDRCFFIKNPAIRSIVDSFFELNKELGFDKYKSYPEALITNIKERKLGLLDRLLVVDPIEKTCILQDYKVNYDFNVEGKEKFTGIPTELNFHGTKLDKLKLQLRFHAQLMELSGWTVLSAHGFVYNGNWNHYKVDLIKNFDIFTGKLINN